MITGAGLPGDVVTLSDSIGVAGVSTVAADGTWSIQPGPLDDGAYIFTAVQTDPAGNPSPASDPLALTIDTATPPTPSAPVLDSFSDSGASGDGLTNVNTPTIDGAGLAGDTITLYDGAAVLGVTIAADDGTWVITTPTLADGLHSLTATQTNPAGTTSSASPALPLTIDTVTPAAPALASGTGLLGTTSTPVITGTGAPGDTVTLYDGTALAGAGTVAADGTWSVTTTLALGPHSLTATQTDPAGNTSVPSSALALQIGGLTVYSALFTYGQTTAATALGIAAPVNTVDTAAPLTITVSALPANGMVTLADGTPLSAGQTLTASQLTGLLFTPSASAGASSSFVYSVTDTAGDAAAGTITLTAVSGAPPISTVGEVPNTPTPTIAGTASAGAAVTLRSDGVVIGSATADPTTGAFAVTPATPLPLGLDRLTVTTVPSGGGAIVSVPLVVFEMQTPVAGVSTTDFSSADIGAALNQGAVLNFISGTQAVQLTDGTLSVGTNTNEATIQRLYEGLLGRGSDTGGISFYDAQLIGGMSVSMVAGQILASPEFIADHGTLTDQQFVAMLFQGLLGRPAAADPNSSFWTNLLANGESRADVAVGIANTAEAKTHLASDTAQIFVPHAPGVLAHELYETGLGREVELTALGNFDTAAAALTPAQFAAQIASSAEFAIDHASQSNAAYVNSLYLDGLGRPADAGASFWTGLLNTGGASRADVLLGIATSAEAAAHLTTNLNPSN